MIYIRILSLIVFIFVSLYPLYPAQNYILKLKFDIVESRKRPTENYVLECLDNIIKRESDIDCRYIIGGLFTLQENINNEFILKGKNLELKLAVNYKKALENRYSVSYDASLSYPLQEDSMKFIYDLIMDYNRISIINKTNLPGKISDTRPYWAIIRLVKAEPDYIEKDLGSIGILPDLKGGYPYIQSIIQGSPAENSGLKIGDKIVEVDDVDMMGRTIQEVIEHIRGKPYTNVKIKILPASAKSSRDKIVVYVERRIVK